LAKNQQGPEIIDFVKLAKNCRAIKYELENPRQKICHSSDFFAAK
jgi:hypothetical protein